MKRKFVTWTFPRPRVHEGLPFANGVAGMLVWGEGNTLRVTIGRADLWDHRGGMPWTPAQNFRDLRAALEKGDERRVNALFSYSDPAPGQPKQPFTVPIGTIALDLGPWHLVSASLDIERGFAEILTHGERIGTRAQTRKIRLDFDISRGVLCLSWPRGLAPTISAHPAWENMEKVLAPLSYKPPVAFSGKATSGWAQALPADPAVAAGWRTDGDATFVGAARGVDERAAIKTLDGILEDIVSIGGLSLVRRASSRWWRRYWANVPQIDIPNKTLQEMHDFGMFKFAGLTHPDGVAATLQGPWIEDTRIPPWSSDYHFNVNVQMCYSPAFHGNHLEHLKPLFSMIRSWWPQLRENARLFAGVEDGFLLPHAVDDRCTCMGGFWTGAVDLGCTAWIASILFRYVRYSGDMVFLRTDAFPFMCGAMRVLRAVMEEQDGHLSLPVSVSPEYRGARMDAWGRDASFQLASAHRLAEDLVEAAHLLEIEPDPSWTDILSRLPKATLVTGERGYVIGLWEGTPLEESHRHHSHLAAIAPFDTIDLDAPEWRDIVRDSFDDWILHGPGLWSGWCIPWASILHARAGHADAAELWLDIFARTYVNDGHGTRHNPLFPGVSMLGRKAFDSFGDDERGGGEIMQLDAGMAAVTAVQELLAHERRGVVRVFKGAPQRWREVEFRGIRVAGGFLISARRSAAKGVEWIEAVATLAGALRIESPWGNKIPIRICASATESCVILPDAQGVITLDIARNEVVRMTGQNES